MVKVFVSYSHKDEILRDGLETHLSLLKNQGVIQVWHDRRIGAGDDFATSIDDNLADSQIILLLVSPDFLASSYCWGVEMKQAMALHEKKIARVIPVILRACDWRSAPFGKLLAVPKDGKPVKSWSDIDEAFHDVARRIRAVVENNAVLAQPRRPMTAQVYCSRCGAAAGTRTECTGSYTHHDFTRFGKFGAFCRRCGASAGIRTTCTGSYTHHDFIDAGESPAYCARCGASAGAPSICTGSYTHHQFRVPE